jgi:hypothetical protein
LNEDVIPVVKALYRSGKYGDPIPQLRGKLDLIFARTPVIPGHNTHPFEIFDGQSLVPISQYLGRHPRPDLIQLNSRMNWLSAGPHGERAGDILVLPRFRIKDPINERYYFGPSYYSEHGSPSLQDSHIPFVIARTNLSGEELRAIVNPMIHPNPTHLDWVPLIRGLLKPDFREIRKPVTPAEAEGIGAKEHELPAD